MLKQILNSNSEDGYELQLYYHLQNTLITFQTKLSLCTISIISGVVPDVFSGKRSSSSTNSLSNAIFENAGNDLNNEVNVDT